MFDDWSFLAATNKRVKVTRQREVGVGTEGDSLRTPDLPRATNWEKWKQRMSPKGGNKELLSFSQRNWILFSIDAQTPHHGSTGSGLKKPISLMGIALTESNRQPVIQPYHVDSHSRERMGSGALEGWVYEQNHKTEKLPSAVRWVAPEGVLLSDMSRQCARCFPSCVDI